MEDVGFRLGQINVALEIPPFFVNFDKRDFSSMMTRTEKEGRKALFYVYISRKNQLSKLLLLKAMHPDIFIPVTLKINEEIDKDEINSFIQSVQQAENDWSYYGIGTWEKTFNSCKVYMVLIIGEDRWTVRPLIAKEGLSGFGAEIPVDIDLSDRFVGVLKEEEKKNLEIHEHGENKHFHFVVHSRERFIQLAKEWDYYFAHKERWRMSVKLT